MNDVLTDRRDRVIDRLSSDYANGHFEVEELERRLALVHAAQTPAELEALVPTGTTTALVPAQRVRVVLGSIERTGPWVVPAQLTARVLWGNLVLDLREARLGTTTTIEARVTMGNLEVIVPPGVDVELDATSLLGNVEQRTTRAPGAGPVVRITGRVKLGNLEVSTMRAGELAHHRWHHRRARRHWRRQLRSMDW
jgi:hypothetical protein